MFSIYEAKMAWNKGRNKLYKKLKEGRVMEYAKKRM